MFTTTDPDVDGTGHCKNGNEAVNCNIYDGKQFVWLTGGPGTSGLAPGDYFFAVMAPGGQGANRNPNDGTPKNLSDVSPTTNTGAGDAWTNRVFTVGVGGTISYGGLHDFDATNGKIRLMGYDDTPNPGGVYILAICAVPSTISTTNPPGVDPSICKYDAFKAKEGEEPPPTGGAEALGIDKDAAGTNDNTYKWTILKSVDKTGRVVLVDQAPRHASVTAMIAADIAEHRFKALKAPVVQVTAADTTVPYSEPLEAYVIPDEARIAAAVRTVLR